MIPEIRTIPIVNLDSKPAPLPITSGMIPITVEKPVMSTGLNRILQAPIIASYDFFPFCLSFLANSIIKIPFLAAIPVKIIKPI